MTGAGPLRRPRIVHVLNSAAPGGGAKQVGALLLGLPEYSGALVCFEPGPLLLDLDAASLPHALVPLGGSRLPGPGLGHLVRALRKLRPDLVHAHGTRAGFFVACVRAALRGVPCVYTERGLAHQRHAPATRRLWGRAVEAFNGRRYDRTVCVSRADLDWALSERLFLARRSRCIHNGIDVRRAPSAAAPSERARVRAALGLAVDAELVLTIGRIELEKGPFDLLEAFALVHAGRPRAHLAWIGSGSLEAAVRRRARALGVGTACSFLGTRADCADYLAACDAFTLASLWEGLPNVLLEALLVERPCAATAVNGVPEILLDGVTGRTAPPRSPRALAAAVLELLADPERSAALGKAGAAHVRRSFPLHATLDGYRKLYAELLR